MDRPQIAPPPMLAVPPLIPTALPERGDIARPKWLAALEPISAIFKPVQNEVRSTGSRTRRGGCVIRCHC